MYVPFSSKYNTYILGDLGNNGKTQSLVLLQSGGWQFSLRHWASYETASTFRHSQSRPKLRPSQTHGDLQAVQSERSRHVQISFRRIYR